jgi:hypothetical protein
MFLKRSPVKKFVGQVLFILSICTIVFGLESIKAQSTTGFQYINPLPNSDYVSAISNIIIRPGDPISRSVIYDDLIEAVGTTSGVHKGKIVLAKDSRTLIFTPFVPFQPNEDVTVTLREGLTTQSGFNVGILKFKFHTCKKEITQIAENSFPNYKSALKISKSYSMSVSDTALPSDLPGIVVNVSNNPSPGYFFLAAAPYLEIVDNEGTPVFYRNVGSDVDNFDLQPDGELTYFIYPGKCYGLNSSLDSVREFSTINGYTVDIHDLRVFPDGRYYIFGKRMVEMDLSNLVTGGDTAAQIIDGALQEFDSDGNLLFQWDALDHYNIQDVDRAVDLTLHIIDFAHFNSVAFDKDGNLLLCARNLDEITKINQNTGEIIWRWGGENNQFTFTNDTLGFARQHDIRFLSNGNVSLFNNGIFHRPPVSNALEYKLDEANKTASLVRRIYHNNIFTIVGGSVQELSNGNILIGWGYNWDPAATEINPDDSVVIDMSLPENIFTYRALKYQWQTNLFTTNTDSLLFERVIPGDSLSKQLIIYNPHNSPVTINEFYCKDSSFIANLKTPVSIEPMDSLVVPVTFKPKEPGIFKTTFNIRNFGRNGYQQMIARQVSLIGKTKDVTSVQLGSYLTMQFKVFQNYPNPFNPSTTITYEIPKESFVVLTVYDILGRLVKTLVNEEKPAGRYSVIFNSNYFSNGVYFYKLKAGNYTQVKKMVLVK